MEQDTPKRILFKCKGNICRSVAAEIILKSYRPGWIVVSCATTPNTVGQVIHPEVVKALEYYNFPVTNRNRGVIFQDWIIEQLSFFDEIHDLHAEGLEDPFRTGAYCKSILEIEDYIHTFILQTETQDV